jgi:hypothetical protein
MGFIELFFRGKKELNSEDIDRFISQKIEENTKLDYKDIRAYHNADDLATHISSFANSEGGLIILGISQDEIEDEKGKITKVYPKEPTWGEVSLDKESMENKLITRIKPPITNLLIKPVRNEKDEVIFLIDIPKSDFAPHMAPDHKYHKRINFRIHAMDHYEVANLFKINWTMKEKLIEEIYEPLSSILERHAEQLLNYSYLSGNEIKQILAKTYYKIQMPWELLDRIYVYVDQIDDLIKKSYHARRATINIVNKNVLEYLKEKYHLLNKGAIVFDHAKVISKSEKSAVDFDVHLIYRLLLNEQKVKTFLNREYWRHAYEKVSVHYFSEAYNINLDEFDEIIWEKCLKEASENTEIIAMKKSADFLYEEAYNIIEEITRQ